MPRRARSRRAPSGDGLSPRELVELATEHGLAELEVEQGGLRIRIVREHPAGAGSPPGGAAAPAPRAETSAAVEEHPANVVRMESPMVGTFYRAPSPTAAPFVNEGDVVKEGQVLCIIEAMKLMNEIESRVAGRVLKILPENAQPVEYGQVLFVIEPTR